MLRPLACVLLLAAAAVAQAELLAKVDPRADDWQAETLATLAGERLSELCSKLATSGVVDAAWFDAAARAVDLGATGTPRAALPDLSVRRSGARSEPAVAAVEALQQWAGLIADSSARAKVKVVSAALDGSVLSTNARIELLSGKGGTWLQRTATWQVRWSVVDGADLRLREITVLTADEVAGPRRWFTEVTDAVLPRALRELPDLRLGGEHWPTRTDRVGESPLMGHQGLALGDVDGDGLEDLYVAMSTGLPNRLLRQRVDGTFEDVAEAAGVAFLDDTKGVLFADMDGDGDQDLLLAIGPFVLLAKNDGKGRFERHVQMRAGSDAAFYHLAVADYDRDGDLDVYGCRYVDEAYGTSIPLPYHDANNGPSNVLFQNDGDDQYVDATVATGLDANNRRFSVAAAWGDVDVDGDLDLYVANDFGRNNLYRNDGGHFTDVAAAAGVEDQAAGMGVAFADVDEDGDLDLYVTNMFSSAGKRIAYQDRFQPALAAAERAAIQEHALGNSLFLNRGDGTFVRSPEPVVRMGRWGWGARFCDLNDDGREDIVAPNGFLTGRLKADL